MINNIAAPVGDQMTALKYSFPTPLNTEQYPYLGSWQQKTMVFCLVYELLINSQIIN
jgi:hypothetical protein